MDLLFGRISKFNTPLHKIDVRVKITSLITYIVIASTISSKTALFAGILLMGALVLLARTPVSYIIKRFLWILPFGGFLIIFFPFITPGVSILKIDLSFVVLDATLQGVDKAAVLFLRLFSAMLALAVLNATTGFREIMEGFKHLKVPQILVQIVEFTVRYIFVLVDELNRMKVARKSRGYDFKQSILNIDALRTLSQMIGVLLIRSVERGERVYNAMLARGYGGEEHCCGYCKIKKQDLCWGTTLVVFAVFLKIAEVGGIT